MTTLINFKTDEKIKNQAQKIANKMGLNLSDVLNIFLRKFIREQEIHISLEEPSDFLIKEIEEAKKEEISPGFNTADSAIKWLGNKKRKYGNKV